METKTIQFGEHTAELKSFITQRDDREIKRPMYEAVRVKDQEVEGISGSVAFASEDKAIETIVLTLDGSKENILQRALDLAPKDFKVLMAEINIVINGIDSEKKTP